jgi:hypothetical protein
VFAASVPTEDVIVFKDFVAGAAQEIDKIKNNDIMKRHRVV